MRKGALRREEMLPNRDEAEVLSAVVSGKA